MTEELFLIGDSHTVAIGQAARRAGLRVIGGPLGAGARLESPFYRVEGGSFELTLPDTGPLRPLFRPLLASRSPVLSTLGFNSHRLAGEIQAYCSTTGVQDWGQAMSRQVFEHMVLEARRTALAFYRMLADHGREVYFTCSPQRVAPHLRDILVAGETILIREICKTGAVFLDHRPQTMDGPCLAAQYANEADTMHGSIEWGQTIVDLFLAQRACAAASS
ncbi:hypothetical protein K3555_21255 (plasmid) [Leisingera sp. M527]|uniref:hypothetical protein n=1 Tax=Leisingera sp. M527 TaxID=2867014 RepID=UPI0021A6DEDC|nr:hypothetical protein [Leisingera sp. M527]UWQ35190.1 hypothetical protein K3555_21255 [Leisingera sp. M527]